MIGNVQSCMGLLSSRIIKFSCAHSCQASAFYHITSSDESGFIPLTHITDPYHLDEPIFNFAVLRVISEDEISYEQTEYPSIEYTVPTSFLISAVVLVRMMTIILDREYGPFKIIVKP